MVSTERSRRLFVTAVTTLASACILCIVFGLAAQFAVMRDRALNFAAQSATHLGMISAEYMGDTLEAADAALLDLVRHASEGASLAHLARHHIGGADTSLLVLDATGRTVRDAGFPEGLADDLAVQGGLHVQTVRRPADGASFLMLSRTLTGADGVVRGVAAVAIPLSRFEKVLRGGERANQAALYLPGGERVAPVGEANFPPARLNPAALEHPIEGMEVHRLETAGLLVGSFVDRDEALRWWRRDVMVSVPIVVVFILVLATGAALLVGTINRSFRRQVSNLTTMRDLNVELEQLVGERTAALQSARSEAERASAAKTRFLAAAAHDLRQPMQALMMFIDELSYRTPPSGDRTIVEKIETSAQSLSNLLNGLLDIGALESGSVQPRTADVALAPVLAAIEARFAKPAHAKGLALTVMHTGLWAQTDPVLLTRILSNLVSNAVRYTETGRILVGCRRRGGNVMVMVADTGIGIAAEQLPLIFEEYYQVANAGRDRRRGTGLGLAIVERLAALQGHTVTVASRPGRGSAFTVCLPLAACAPGAATTCASEQVVNGDGALVVVVEDDPEVRQALARALGNRRYTVLPAASGREALDLLRWAGRPPAAIVADYRLGDGDNGIQVIATLRALHPASTVAAIVLTGEQVLDEELPEDVVLLRKPLPPATLCATLQHLRTRQLVVSNP